MDEFSLAVDVEATCDDKGSIARQDMEIIEIGAVLLDADMEQIDEFQTFIKPFRHPVLTPFCIELTSITQEQVDDAPTVFDAFGALGAWLGSYQPLRWYSWGDYDNNQFRKDCERTGAPWPFPGPHFNAKKIHADQRRNGKKTGLFEAIEEEGLTWIGTHHRGIDDARNVAQILRLLQKEG